MPTFRMQVFATRHLFSYPPPPPPSFPEEVGEHLAAAKTETSSQGTDRSTFQIMCPPTQNPKPETSCLVRLGSTSSRSNPHTMIPCKRIQEPNLCAMPKLIMKGLTGPGNRIVIRLKDDQSKGEDTKHLLRNISSYSYS